MIDLVLVKRDLLQDVKAVRGMGRCLSDHYVVLCKVKLVGGEKWRRLTSEPSRQRPPT